MANEPRLNDADVLLRKLQRRREDFVSGWRIFDALPITARCKYEENLECSLMVEDAPTVDAVEAVRCKDCKHTETDGTADPAIYCKKWDRWEMPEDFFCAYGERKGNE